MVSIYEQAATSSIQKQVQVPAVPKISKKQKKRAKIALALSLAPPSDAVKQAMKLAAKQKKNRAKKAKKAKKAKRQALSDESKPETSSHVEVSLF